MPEPRIEAARLWGWLMQLAQITEPEAPWTRRAFTPRFAQGRAWLTERMRELELAPGIDSAGNLLGRLPGSRSPERCILVGSHSDTVKGGGRFDGIAGVIAGLELAAALRASGQRLQHTLQIADFLAEEPNDFGLSCIGSRGIGGALEPAMLERKSPTGRSLREGLAEVGAPPFDPHGARRDDIAAMFELHIEQGPVLEQAQLDVGIVTHIVGIRRLSIRFEGQASHAGTTPLALRRDALAAASHLVLALREALPPPSAAAPYVIATVGELQVVPNAPNVVPGQTRLTVDLRSDDAASLEAWSERLRELAQAAAAAARVRLGELRVLSASEPTACAPHLAEHLRAAARALGLKQQDMVSGAGHDAAFIARVAPAAMLFVPSRAGLSHCAEEWTEPEELANGVAALLAAVLRFDGS